MIEVVVRDVLIKCCIANTFCNILQFILAILYIYIYTLKIIEMILRENFVQMLVAKFTNTQKWFTDVTRMVESLQVWNRSDTSHSATS